MNNRISITSDDIILKPKFRYWLMKKISFNHISDFRIRL